MRRTVPLPLISLLWGGFLLVDARAMAQTAKPAQEQAAVTLNTAQDARLAKPFPLQVRSQTLDAILQQLRHDSGIALRVDAAWIGELRVNAFTRPLPLHRLLERLAQVHRLSWRQETPPSSASPHSASQNENAAPRYVLYESDLDRRYIAYLKRRSWEPFRRDLAQLRHYVTLPPQELERLAQNGDIVASRLIDPQERACAILKTSLPDTGIDELIGKPNRNRALSYNQLSSEAQEALSSLVQQRWEQQVKNLKKAEEDGMQVPPAAYEPPKLDTYRVTYSLQGQGTWASLMVMVQDSVSAFSSDGAGSVYDPASIWIAEKRAQTRSVVRPERRAEARRTPAAVAVTTRHWPEAMEAAATKWNLNLFSEAPRDVKRAALPQAIPFHVPARSPLTEGLGLLESWGGRWWQASEDGDDVIFQSASWYETRGNAADTALLARLKKVREEGGPFTLEIMADLADASERTQQEAERRLSIEPLHLRQCAEALRFYRSLSAREKKTLEIEGITYSALRDRTQRRLFGEMLQAANAALTDPMQQETRLRLTLDQGWSHFTLESAEGNAALLSEWRVRALPAARLSGKSGGVKP